MRGIVVQARVRLFLPKPAFIHVYESEVIMKIPYGYVLANREIIVHEERADVVRSIFGSINEQIQELTKAVRQR